MITYKYPDKEKLTAYQVLPRPQHFRILFEQQRKLMRYKGHAFSGLLRTQQASRNEQQTDHVDNAEKWLELTHFSFFTISYL